MASLVASDKEPITTYLERIRELWVLHGVSSLVVLGGCGSYFAVADTVLQLDCYEVRDVTQRAKEIYLATTDLQSVEMTSAEPSDTHFHSNFTSTRSPILSSLRVTHDDRARYTVFDKHVIKVGKDGQFDVNLGRVDQIAEVGQTRFIAEALQWLSLQPASAQNLPLKTTIEALYALILTEGGLGLDTVCARGQGASNVALGNLSLPRRFELAAAVNRWRGLKCV